MIAKALLAHGSCVFCDNGRVETRFYVTLDKDADETIYACLRCVAKYYGPGVIELDTSDDARIILGVTSHGNQGHATGHPGRVNLRRADIYNGVEFVFG